MQFFESLARKIIADEGLHTSTLDRWRKANRIPEKWIKDDLLRAFRPPENAFSEEMATALIQQHNLSRAVFYKWRAAGKIPARYFAPDALAQTRRYRVQPTDKAADFNDARARQLVETHNLDPTTYKRWKHRGKIPLRYLTHEPHKTRVPLEDALQAEILVAMSCAVLHPTAVCELAGVKYPRYYDARRGVAPLPLADLLRLATRLTMLSTEAQMLVASAKLTPNTVPALLRAQLRAFANRPELKTKQFAAFAPLAVIRRRLTHWLFDAIKLLEKKEFDLLISCAQELAKQLAIPLLTPTAVAPRKL